MIGSGIFLVQNPLMFNCFGYNEVLRNAEGVMGDRHISRKREGNMLSSCVTPAHMNTLEKQQEEVLVGIIVEVKRADKITCIKLKWRLE